MSNEIVLKQTDKKCILKKLTKIREIALIFYYHSIFGDSIDCQSCISDQREYSEYFAEHIHQRVFDTGNDSSSYRWRI